MLSVGGRYPLDRAICKAAVSKYRILVFQMVSLIIAFSNTVANPIIYAVLYPQFRAQVADMTAFVRRKCSCGK